MIDYKKLIEDQVRDSAQVKLELLQNQELLGQIEQAARICVKAYKDGCKTIWAGNGGSAADAQHMAGEMVSKFCFDRPALPSIALTTDTSIITAIGNDYGFDQLFKRQILANGCKGDVFIGISTSGNSKNLVEALEACRSRGITTIAITGSKKCLMDDWDLVIKVPSAKTPRIQECQTLIGHILCGIVEQEMFGNN